MSPISAADNGWKGQNVLWGKRWDVLLPLERWYRRLGWPGWLGHNCVAWTRTYVPKATYHASAHDPGCQRPAAEYAG